MTDLFSTNSEDLILLRNKGKRLHRRTQSTFNLDFLQPLSKESNHEIIQEMAQTHNILDANLTQKILDAPVTSEFDKEIIVDDIDEIPYSGAIAPRLNSNNNPLAFIKRRNLSAVPSNIGNHCPVKKINLLLDNNLDDIIGLDTIYEKRNSIESLDIDATENLHSNEDTDLSCGKNTSIIFEEPLKEVNRGVSSELRPFIPKTKNQSITEKKSIHSRQSSADFAFQNSRREILDFLDKKEDSKNLKVGRPAHSKHSSIDFSNKENLKPLNVPPKNETEYFAKKPLIQPFNERIFSTNTSSMKSLRVTRFDSLPSKQPSKQSLQPSDKRVKEVNILECNKQKKSVDKERNFYTLPAQTNGDRFKTLCPKDFINFKNQSMNEVQPAIEKKNPLKNNNPKGKMGTIGENGKHYRTVTSIIGATSSTSKNQKSQLSQLLEKIQPDCMIQKDRKSISPFKKNSVPERSVTPKENSKGAVKNQKFSKDKTEKKLIKIGIEIPETKIVHSDLPILTQPNKNMECSMKKLIVKTDFLEEQLGNILHYVSSFKNEEAQLKEKVKTQEDQIKSLQEMLVKYEEEMINLKTGKSVCKTEGDSKKKSSAGKENSDLRLITTTDTSSHESPFTEPSSSYLTCKETKTKRGKTSPFSTVSSGYSSTSTKNNPKKVTESLLTEYKNFLKKGFLSQNKNKMKW